jgi:hypothetical protein
MREKYKKNSSNLKASAGIDPALAYSAGRQFYFASLIRRLSRGK